MVAGLDFAEVLAYATQECLCFATEVDVNAYALLKGTGLFCLALFITCGGTLGQPQKGPVAEPTSEEPVPVGRYGVACRLFGSQNLSPPIFRVADLNKTGVPRLSEFQQALIERIIHYRGQKELPHLWFAFVGENRDRFIVFDTALPTYTNSEPPCVYGVAPGYEVLNIHNAYYESGEKPDITMVMEEVPGTPAPWMSPSPPPF